MMNKTRIQNALWSAFIGDSLAMPVHWYYSADDNRAALPEGVTSYESPPHPHPDSFMVGMSYQPDTARADTLGRPYDIFHEHAHFYRTSYSNFEFQVDSREDQHGNASVAESERNHYHHGLRAGDSTRGAHLLRVLMRSVNARRGYSHRVYLRTLSPTWRSSEAARILTLKSNCASGLSITRRASRRKTVLSISATSGQSAASAECVDHWHWRCITSGRAKKGMYDPKKRPANRWQSPAGTRPV